MFFVDLNEWAAAAHAAGFISVREVEFGADISELFLDCQGGWNPEGADFAADDRAAIEEHAVGGEEDAAALLSLADEFGI